MFCLISSFMYLCFALLEMNLGAQSLPDSPLSFGDAKGSDDDSCDRGSEHAGTNCC